MRGLAVIVVLSMMAFMSDARAAGPGNLEGTANSTVVTATRVEDEAARVPASVAVISGDEIRNSTAINVDDALRSLPGVSILRNYGIGYGIPNQINVRGVPGLHGS